MLKIFKDMKGSPSIPSGYVKIANWKITIEIMDFPMKDCDFPVGYFDKLPEGKVLTRLVDHVLNDLIGNSGIYVPLKTNPKMIGMRTKKRSTCSGWWLSHTSEKD